MRTNGWVKRKKQYVVLQVQRLRKRLLKKLFAHNTKEQQAAKSECSQRRWSPGSMQPHSDTRLGCTSISSYSPLSRGHYEGGLSLICLLFTGLLKYSSLTIISKAGTLYTNYSSSSSKAQQRRICPFLRSFKA